MIDVIIQSIVAKWNLDIDLYKEFPPQEVSYPFVTFKLTPSGINRTFCSDLPEYSVIFTVYTQSESSSLAQTTMNSIKTLYNRTSISGLLYNKIFNEITVKDDSSGFYTGSATYLISIEQSV